MRQIVAECRKQWYFCNEHISASDWVKIFNFKVTTEVEIATDIFFLHCDVTSYQKKKKDRNFVLFVGSWLDGGRSECRANGWSMVSGSPSLDVMGGDLMSNNSLTITLALSKYPHLRSWPLENVCARKEVKTVQILKSPKRSALNAH